VYRDDPLDDELELRAIIGDAEVDALLAADRDDAPHPPVEAALEALRVLQGWVGDEEAGRWFSARQKRLDERTPLRALLDGDPDEVLDVARRWAAAQG
jgi:hypothetical protein